MATRTVRTMLLLQMVFAIQDQEVALQNLALLSAFFICVWQLFAKSENEQVSRKIRSFVREPRQAVEFDIIHKGIWLRLPDLGNKEWRTTYRMTYPTFCKLVDLLKPYVMREWNLRVERERVEVDRAIAIVIYRLAYAGSPKRIGREYCVGAATVVRYTKLITYVLSRHLLSSFISIPTGHRMERTIEGFKMITGIPQMWGAIDGSHIPLAQIPNQQQVPAAYYNRHHGHSILLQGLCDSRRLFLDICLRCPGSRADSAHLKMSSLWKKVNDGTVAQTPVCNIEGHLVKPFIVGDSAYPLTSFLLKAFNNKQEGTADQNMFDRHLRKGRVRIENAFGMLKSRFRILKNLNVGLSYAVQTTVACCVLHNFLILNGETLPEDYVETTRVEDEDEENRRVPERAPVELRNEQEGNLVRARLFRSFIATHT